MKNLPKCEYCGSETKFTWIKATTYGYYDLVCSKCHKHQNINKEELNLLIEQNKDKLD